MIVSQCNVLTIRMERNNREIGKKYCRTCLQELDGMQIISPEIAEKLKSMTVNFEPDDEYPKQLCNCCLSLLNKFNDFRIMCITSLQRFREILLSNTNAIEDEANTTLAGKSTIEPNTNCLVHSTELLESEIHRVVVEETSSLENPLEIDSQLLCTRAKPEATSRDLKSLEAFSTAIECETTSCEGRFCQETKDVLNNEEESTNASFVKHPSRTNSNRWNTKHHRNHIEEESPLRSSKVFQCELCSMRFFVEHRYTAHKRSHDGLIPYPCPRENCERGFKRWHCLSEHLKQHEGTNRWFMCEESGCDRRYKHKTTLDLHIRRYHKKGRELKSFVCEICGKVFKSSAILNDHRFTHKDKSELPFACSHPQCKFRFSNKEKLKVHVMRHAGIKKFVCPHCGMRKTTRNELNVHINYHTLERRFPCRFCSQVCNNAGNLKVHIRTVHERAKDYACRFCERTFAKPDTRKYHEMIHTGEKPHQCSECGKRFVQPAALRTHRKIHLRKHHKRCDSSHLDIESNEEAAVSTV